MEKNEGLGKGNKLQGDGGFDEVVLEVQTVQPNV